MRRMDWRPLVVPLSIGGYINGIVWLAVGFIVYDWQFPGIDVYVVFTPAGQDFLADRMPYGGLFFYGPPWAPILGAFALGPEWLLHATIVVLDVVALWVIAGRSWVGVGYLLWFPLVMSEMAAGQLNILCAGAMVEAQRGRVWPLALMAWAKIWPALALPIRSWRSFAVAALAFGAIAIPWPHLFPDWIEGLIGNLPDPVAPLIPVPFLVRLPIALVLIALQRPWSRTLGALLASPNMYWGQLVVVIAPLSLWVRSRLDARRGSPGIEQAPHAAPPAQESAL